MKSLYLHLAVTITVLQLLLLPETCALITKRCQSVCSRSDGQDFCQRCRMRVPMRFGKRTGSSSKNAVSAEDDQSRFDDSSQNGPSSENLRAESQVILSSIRNFLRDLEEWNRNFYDQ